MLRLSDGRFVLLICLVVLHNRVHAEDPFQALGSDSELWKSFQEDMKQLEQAAHKMSSLLVKAVHSKPTASGTEEEEEEEEGPEALAREDVSEDVNEQEKEETGTQESTGDNKDEVEDIDPFLAGLRRPSNPLTSLLGIFKTMHTPWWKGKNVCVEKSEKIEEKNSTNTEIDKTLIIMGTGTFEHCRQSSAKYICTTVISSPQSHKTVSETYQCCEGFHRGPQGCEQVNLKEAVEVVDSVGCREFASLLRAQHVLSSLADLNITIFAPSDEAMHNHNVDYQESNQIARAMRKVRAVEEWNDIAQPRLIESSPSVRGIALAHITNSLLDVDDLSNEIVLKSLYNESPLRVNLYPGREEPVMTVNCARVMSWGHLASHARVHTVNRVLQPVTQSVIDILAQPQFSQFRNFLEQEGLLERLANASAVTVFAPNNEAWDKLGEGLKDKYLRGEACIGKVLRHHVLPLTLCSAPVTKGGRLTTVDLDGESVGLTNTDDGILMVNDKGRVVSPDIVATNGVVHELDKILTPKSAKPLSELLVSSNHTSWLSVLERAGMIDELNRLDNITLFVPNELALQEEGVQQRLDAMDKEQLRQLVQYHVTQQAPSCDFKHMAELQTHSGHTLRVSIANPFAMFAGFEPSAAVQCVPLGLTDGKACHATAHQITRLLLPPNGTVLQQLSSNSQLSILRRVVEGTQLEKDMQDKAGLFANGITLLAPSDDAFNKLDEDTVTKLLTDKTFAEQVVTMHLLKDPICCSSISAAPWPFNNYVQTVSGHKMEVLRDERNHVLFGTTTSETCDIMATDGIIHIVDSVLLPETSKMKLGSVAFGSPNRRIFLYGI